MKLLFKYLNLAPVAIIVFLVFVCFSITPAVFTIIHSLSWPFFFESYTMGCVNSSVRSDDNGNMSKYHRFLSRVNSGEPLAVALKDVYCKFMESCDSIAEGRRKSFKYPSSVQVNKSVAEAKRARLTYEEAKATASEFLGYAMECLRKKNWGGQIHTNLHGAEGRKSDLQISGCAEFDCSQASIKQSIECSLQFFCALE